jgi:hypothetical protein
MHYFCTYFDSNYLPLGLTLLRSLRKNAAPCTLFVLCLDDKVREILLRMAMKDVVPVRLQEVEDYFPRLLEAKKNRSQIEYYFTLSPALPLYLLRTRADIDVLTYVDADMFLFGRFDSLMEELGTGSVLLVKHYFEGEESPKQKLRGKYNVGILFFRNDENGRKCLAWWHERCLEWCYDRAEGGRYADQKYLDEFQDLFPGVVTARNIGIHAAPWNFQASNHLVRRSRTFLIRDKELLFYHFHGLRIITPGLVDSGMTYSNIKWSKPLLQLYHEYAKELLGVLALLERDGWKAGANVRYAEGGLKPIDYLLKRRVFVRIGPWTLRVFLGPVTERLLKIREFLLGRGNCSKRHVTDSQV